MDAHYTIICCEWEDTSRGQQCTSKKYKGVAAPPVPDLGLWQSKFTTTVWDVCARVSALCQESDPHGHDQRCLTSSIYGNETMELSFTAHGSEDVGPTTILQSRMHTHTCMYAQRERNTSSCIALNQVFTTHHSNSKHAKHFPDFFK